MQETVIHIEQLSKAYKGSAVKSLDKVHFDILKGEKFGIFGPNGAGKTTLISLLCGLFDPTSGKVTYTFPGKPGEVRSIRDKIGYVPQEYAFFQELTPEQNLAYFGALYGIPKPELKQRIAALMHILGLGQVADKKVQTFSGGMKRRVNLAIGMINNPEILFLDEPTVGVDVQSKTAIMQYLEALNKKGTTIIYTSHHLSEGQAFCDRILMLDHGKLIAFGKLDELLARHKVATLEAFLIQLTGSEYRD